MKFIKQATVLAAIATVVTVVGISLPSTAFAAPTPTSPPNNSPTKMAQITVAPTGSNVTSLSIAQPVPPTGGVTGFAAVTGTGGVLQASGTKLITPPGGTKAGLYDAFKSTVASGLTTVSLHGTSQAIWEGVKPVNATKISLSDTISASGLDLSFSAGPIGVGMSHSSSSWKWTTSVANNYILTHSYSGLQFSGSLTAVNESSQTEADFATAGYIQITQ